MYTVWTKPCLLKMLKTSRVILQFVVGKISIFWQLVWLLFRQAQHTRPSELTSVPLLQWHAPQSTQWAVVAVWHKWAKCLLSSLGSYTTMVVWQKWCQKVHKMEESVEIRGLGLWRPRTFMDLHFFSPCPLLSSAIPSFVLGHLIIGFLRYEMIRCG